MTRLKVEHTTLYRYARPVAFNEHRLMFRPRDSHDLRLIDATLSISPPARVRWHHDVFGNSIAIASFDAGADSLRFVSTVIVEKYAPVYPEFSIEPYARTVPFTYASEMGPDLGGTMERHYPDPDRRVDAWARQFLGDDGSADTQALLFAMTRAINERFSYETRTEPGVRTPVETLDAGSGSCRDFALLLMEAARSLGLAAQFVTGYLYDPSLDGAGEEMVGAGSSHAWAQIYLPGAGWVEFDPTNGLVGGTNLIRVGVARDPSQAIPVQGAYAGAAEDFIDMTVEVRVTAAQPPRI